MIEAKESFSSGPIDGRSYSFEPDEKVGTSSTGGDFTIEPEPEVPASFFEAMKDIEEGNIVDLDTALNQPPPED